MLNMRITRAPLSESENLAILDGYNRLTGSVIPLNEFVRWVAESPSGPAWHAILETDDSKIVGHTSLFPLHVAGSLLPAKSEYSFLNEDFRKEKIRGYESAGRPPFITLLDQLFQHCLAEGWGPIFASTNGRNQVFTRKVGLRPIEFPLTECLLILRPSRSAQLTPNLTRLQRASMFSAGLAHGLIWPLAAKLRSQRNQIHEAHLHHNGFLPEPERPLVFFEDSASLQWRYLEGQYARIGVHGSPGDYLIIKNGSCDRFLRVLQWHLETLQYFPALFTQLVRMAVSQKALGVRWAVYDTDPNAEAIVDKLRKRGLLCVRRERIVMVHKAHEAFLDPSKWKMNDSLFSFDP